MMQVVALGRPPVSSELSPCKRHRTILARFATNALYGVSLSRWPVDLIATDGVISILYSVVRQANESLTHSP